MIEELLDLQKLVVEGPEAVEGKRSFESIWRTGCEKPHVLD